MGDLYSCLSVIQVVASQFPYQVEDTARLGYLVHFVENKYSWQTSVIKAQDSQNILRDGFPHIPVKSDAVRRT